MTRIAPATMTSIRAKPPWPWRGRNAWQRENWEVKGNILSLSRYARLRPNEVRTCEDSGEVPPPPRRRHHEKPAPRGIPLASRNRGCEPELRSRQSGRGLDL